LPNGKVAKGSTDGKGKAKIQGFVSGVANSRYHNYMAIASVSGFVA